MKNIPPFQNFLAHIEEHVNEISYDVANLDSKCAERWLHCFSNEEIGVISCMITTMIIAHLRQYHQWIVGQIDGADEQQS